MEEILLKGLLYSLFHNSNDCQAWGVNKAFEPIYSRHFLHFLCMPEVHVQKRFCIFIRMAIQVKKTMEYVLRQHMILGIIAQIVCCAASKQKPNE